MAIKNPDSTEAVSLQDHKRPVEDELAMAPTMMYSSSATIRSPCRRASVEAWITEPVEFLSRRCANC